MNRLVRRTDPWASFAGLDRLNLPERRQQAIDILRDLAWPTSAQGIRDEATRLGCSPTVAESIRRRAHELEEDGYLFKVSEDDGSGAPLWFTKIPLPPINGTAPVSSRRRRVHRQPPVPAAGDDDGQR